jgi:hypothetical protein
VALGRSRVHVQRVCTGLLTEFAVIFVVRFCVLLSERACCAVCQGAGVWRFYAGTHGAELRRVLEYM